MERNLLWMCIIIAAIVNMVQSLQIKKLESKIDTIQVQIDSNKEELDSLACIIYD